MLLTALEPSAVESGLLPLVGPLTRRHRVVLASVRDPEIDRLAARGAATPGRRTPPRPPSRPPPERDRTARLLATLGVEVLDADADELAVRLADHYLGAEGAGLAVSSARPAVATRSSSSEASTSPVSPARKARRPGTKT